MWGAQTQYDPDLVLTLFGRRRVFYVHALLTLISRSKGVLVGGVALGRNIVKGSFQSEAVLVFFRSHRIVFYADRSVTVYESLAFLRRSYDSLCPYRAPHTTFDSCLTSRGRYKAGFDKVFH